MSGLIAAGDVYLDRFVNGVSTGAFHGPLNANKFSVTSGKSSSVERTSYMKDSFGQVLDSVVIPGAAEISMTIDDADPEVLQYALMGTLTDDAIIAGTVTDEAVTASLGRFIKLAHRDVSTVVVKNSAGSTTYALGTDYVVSAGAGMVKPLAGGAITDAQALKISYAYAAVTGKKIIAATSASIITKIYFNGINLANSKKVELTAYHAVLMPKGTLEMIGKKFVDFELTGSLIVPTGFTGPYEYRELN